MDSHRPIVKPDARSPYQKYGKTAHRYSPIYQEWRKLMMSGNEADARAVAMRHAARFLGIDVMEEEAVI